MWRITRVVEVKTGEDGIVRTIRVSFRPRHVSDLGKKYKSKKAEEMEIGVQRFAVLLPVEEQGNLETEVESVLSDPESSEMTEN